MAPKDFERWIHAGEKFGQTVRFSSDDIAAFARLSLDTNPLHVDARVARRARFGEIIASGQQTAAVLMGVLASHFSRSDDDDAPQMICLNMNFAFKRPVFADHAIELSWVVGSVEWNSRLKGALAQLDGRAAVENGQPAVVARGTILLAGGE